MIKQKVNSEIAIEDLKKSIDRLAVIELIKAGATRDQIRQVVPMGNEMLSKIRQAMKKVPIGEG